MTLTRLKHLARIWQEQEGLNAVELDELCQGVIDLPDEGPTVAAWTELHRDASRERGARRVVDQALAEAVRERDEERARISGIVEDRAHLVCRLIVNARWARRWKAIAKHYAALVPESPVRRHLK